MAGANQGQVAIVTGAGKGIGRAIALELARRGFRVVVAARSAESVIAVAKEVDGMGVATDVADPAQVDRLVGKTLDTFGRIDAVVNNAGLAPAVSIEEMSVEQWRQVIDVNLSAAFYLSRAAWGTFKKQRSGVVVNVSSQAARDPCVGVVPTDPLKSDHSPWAHQGKRNPAQFTQLIVAQVLQLRNILQLADVQWRHGI